MVKYMKKLLITMVMVGLLAGCGTLYKGIVTVTQIRENAMHELAVLSKAGKISAATDVKIAAADAKYREAAQVAQVALTAYKESGDKSQYLGALAALKTALQAVLDILYPLVTQTEAASLQSQLYNATQL